MSRIIETKKSDIVLSVVIPCFNHGEFILEAIASVENCLDPVYEIIIINDGSTEPLTEKVLDYLKAKNYGILDQKNQGLAQARNAGIEIAKGRYILTLDSDNKIRADYITKSIAILDENPAIGVVYGNAEFFGDKTGISQVPDFDLNRIAIGNYIDACAVFRKVVWKDCGGYDSKIPEKFGYEDWDFWLSTVEQGWQFYHIDEVLFDYRVRAHSMVSRCNIPENRRRLMQYICTKHLGIYHTNFANVIAEKDAKFLEEEQKVQDLQNELDQLQEQVQEHPKILDKAHNLLQEKQEQLEQYQAHARNLEALLHPTKVQLENTQAELTNCHTQLAHTQHELTHTQTQLTHTQNELTNTQNELTHTQTQLTHTQHELNHTRTQLTNTQNELTYTQTQLTNTQNELTNYQTHAHNLEIARQVLQTQLEEIQGNLGQCEDYNQHLQTELNSSQQQKQETEIHLKNCQLQVEMYHNQLESIAATLSAIESSKFSKLRRGWFKIKKCLGLIRKDT